MLWLLSYTGSISTIALFCYVMEVIMYGSISTIAQFCYAMDVIICMFYHYNSYVLFYFGCYHIEVISLQQLCFVMLWMLSYTGSISTIALFCDVMDVIIYRLYLYNSSVLLCYGCYRILCRSLQRLHFVMSWMLSYAGSISTAALFCEVMDVIVYNLYLCNSSVL